MKFILTLLSGILLGAYLYHQIVTPDVEDIKSRGKDKGPRIPR